MYVFVHLYSGQYQNYPSYYGSGYTQAEQSYGTSSGNQQVAASAQNQHVPFQNPSAQNQHIPFQNPSAQNQHMPFQNPHSYGSSNGRAAPGGYNSTAGSASDGYSTSYNYPHDARQTTVASGSQFSSYDHTVAPNSYSHMGGHSTAQL